MPEESQKKSGSTNVSDTSSAPAVPSTTSPATGAGSHAAPSAVPSVALVSATPARKSNPWPLRAVIAIVVLGLAAYLGGPMVWRALNTVSTDDAYVNSHVTVTAARVSGQVIKVLVDDNNRVHQGDVIVELDKEPYQVQLNIAKATLEAAEADLAAANAQVRSTISQARSNRFRLIHSMEDVNNQIAKLRANIATWKSRKATLERAKADYERAKNLVGKGAVSKTEYDKAEENLRVGEADVTAALEQIHQVRVSLGLPAQTESGDLSEVPADLDQQFSAVRQALSDMLASIAPLGMYPRSFDSTPDEVVKEFYARDPSGDLDKIYTDLSKSAPSIKQAEARQLRAKRDVEQAELNLRYCTVYAEIDGVVTRRNVNPGNNVQAGQSLMAIRSLTEVWVDANFKETQLRNLRIGQRVEMEVDMYGKRRSFEGRITGFTMGTGSTLALLPPQNATGNFIKVVQRLPVRIEPVNYDPDTETLFVGLSVVPYVFIKEPATGPDAGKLLQPPLFAEQGNKNVSAPQGAAR